MIANVIRWCLTIAVIVWVYQSASWIVTVAIALLFVRAELSDACLLRTQSELTETRELLADYVEADCAFTNAVTRVLDQQFRALDKQEMLSTLQATARSVTRH